MPEARGSVAFRAGRSAQPVFFYVHSPFLWCPSLTVFSEGQAILHPGHIAIPAHIATLAINSAPLRRLFPLSCLSFRPIGSRYVVVCLLRVPMAPVSADAVSIAPGAFRRAAGAGQSAPGCRHVFWSTVIYPSLYGTPPCFFAQGNAPESPETGLFFALTFWRAPPPGEHPTLYVNCLSLDKGHSTLPLPLRVSPPISPEPLFPLPRYEQPCFYMYFSIHVYTREWGLVVITQ